jgi:plastocyanin
MPSSHARAIRSRLVLATLALATLAAGACGADDDTDTAASDVRAGVEAATTATTATSVSTATTATAATTTPAEITIAGFLFKPAGLTVTAGTTVTWVNTDDILHTASSGVSDGTVGTKDNRFDGEMPGKGKSFSFTFSDPGTYKYFCARHNSMIGEVVVG